MQNEDFEVWLGRIGDKGSSARKKYAHQVRTAINRAGGIAGRKSGFKGSRIGRGSAMGAWLAHGDRHASLRHRRVVVKGRIVKLAGRGMDKAAAHLRYVQREGSGREGERGQLYSADQDRADGREFLDKAKEDRHQFRFIVAPEDGIEYGDFKDFTRRLMSQMEEDLGTRLDWVASDHYNTGHPHIHILLRGADDMGRDLIIARDYISAGIRERASELVSLDLGPRSDIEIQNQLRAEMTTDRVTGLDKQLLGMCDEQGILSPLMTNDAARQTLLTGRLKYLERLGLAEDLRHGKWELDPDLKDTLRLMGERGDIIKTMHREMTEKNISRSSMDYAIYDPTNTNARSITGRVIARGLSDELNDRHYLIVDATDGRTHYIDIGDGAATEPTPVDSVVRITSRSLEPRKADLTVAEVAAANGGKYSLDIHLRHDQRATDTFVETHIRRLEAIRKVTGALDRESDGSWIISPNHLEQARNYERAIAKRTPVLTEKLSSLSIERQIGADGVTWIDKTLVSGNSEPIRDSGFGREMRDAMLRRRQWLIEQGLAQEEQGKTVYRANMLNVLQRRELTRVAGQLSGELGLRYMETRVGECADGTLLKPIELTSGKFAILQKSREFTLVPWRPVLDHHIGQHVSGIMRANGISWTIGRQKGIDIS